MENEWILKSNIIRFYSSVSEDDKLRDASRAAKVLLEVFQTESLMMQDIFRLITAVRERKEALDQESTLFLERTYQQRLLTGVGIAESSKRYRFKVIQKRLSEASATFQETVNKDESYIRLKISELDGVPQNILSQLDKTERDDEYQAYLADYSHMQALAYAASPVTRRKLYQARNNRCSKNRPLLMEAVLLRHVTKQPFYWGLPTTPPYSFKTSYPRGLKPCWNS